MSVGGGKDGGKSALIAPCITEAGRSSMVDGSPPDRVTGVLGVPGVILGVVLELSLGVVGQARKEGRRVPGMRIWKLGTEVLYSGRVKGGVTTGEV